MLYAHLTTRWRWVQTRLWRNQIRFCRHTSALNKVLCICHSFQRVTFHSSVSLSFILCSCVLQACRWAVPAPPAAFISCLARLFFHMCALVSQLCGFQFLKSKWPQQCKGAAVTVNLRKRGEQKMKWSSEHQRCLIRTADRKSNIYNETKRATLLSKVQLNISSTERYNRSGNNGGSMFLSKLYYIYYLMRVLGFERYSSCSVLENESVIHHEMPQRHSVCMCVSEVEISLLFSYWLDNTHTSTPTNVLVCMLLFF